MYSYAPTSDCNPTKCPLVVALGCFDGVHLGHRRLLACAKEQATALGLPLLVYSPESKKGQAFLSTPDEKRALLGSLGANAVVLADFDAIKGLLPEEFVQKILIGQLDCRIAVCGYNFSFGKMASGNADTLRQLMEAQGRAALVQPPVDQDGEPVSSTRIRSLLSAGQIEQANCLLCRPYSLSGKVSHGRAIGRTLGFPTVNLPFLSGKLPPRAGVYYSRVRTGDSCHAAVTNIGVRPTFKDVSAAPTLEAHLLDFSGDLYEKEIVVELVRFLRPERAFTDPMALKEAVMRDIESAKQLAAQDSILIKTESI